MKIKEFLSEAIDLPNDGKGNYIVWDPQRRTEVVVPEKDVIKMMSDHRIIGGAFSTGKPTQYPINKSVIYQPRKAIDPNAPKVKPKSPDQGFISGFKKGFKGVQSAADDLAYSPVGRALGKVNQWAKADVRKSTFK
jgi:hypothetical protein